MPRIYSFKAVIKSIKYSEGIHKNKLHKDEPFYYAQAELIELAQGRCKKRYHNAQIYLTEEEYINEIYGENDRIEISDKAKWKSNPFKFNCYDSEKLKNYPNGKLKKDSKDRTYGKFYVNAYVVEVPVGQLKIVEKAEEIAFWKINKTKIFVNEEAMDIDANSVFFNDKEKFDSLLTVNNKIIPIKFYFHKLVKKTCNALIQTAFDEDSKRYFVNIILQNDEEKTE